MVPLAVSLPLGVAVNRDRCEIPRAQLAERDALEWTPPQVTLGNANIEGNGAYQLVIISVITERRIAGTPSARPSV